jgi:hypothetical protein
VGDLAKIAGGVIGNALWGGALGEGIGAAAVVVGEAVYDSYDSSVAPGAGVNCNVEYAAL